MGTVAKFHLTHLTYLTINRGTSSRPVRERATFGTGLAVYVLQGASRT